MNVREVICCSTSPLNSSLGPGSIALHDLQTGTALASFKQTSAGRHSTSVIRTKDGQGGLVLAAQADKALLNVYNFQKDQLHLRIVLPEKLTCIALDDDGFYCAGGTAAGRIYLWEVASGILFNVFEAHYRKINAIKFTSDGATIIAGSDDSGVTVWSLSRLLDMELQHQVPTPHCTLSDHTLPVNDIYCGFGSFPNYRILTASSDNTCKLWDLSTRSIIATFIFPQPISVVTMDPSERVFFAASPNGSIHQVNLIRKPLNKVGHRVEPAEPTATGDIIRIDGQEVDENNRLISVKNAVTSLCISFTGSNLIVGTSTGEILVIDIASHQILRTISTHQGYSINYVSTMLKPPDLIGHVSLTQGTNEPSIPVRPISSFHRVRDAAARERHEVLMILPVQPETSRASLPDYDYLADHRYFLSQSSSGTPDVSMQARVAELEAEVANLRQNLGKAKGLNDAMWESVVSTVLNVEKPSTKSSDSGVEGRAKKRGRTGGAE